MRAMTGGPRPLVLFDGDCGFCKRWVARWRQDTGGRVRFAPGTGWLRALLGVPKKDMLRAMQLVEPSGRRSSGAEAVFRMLAWSPRWSTRAAARLGLLPGVRQVAGAVYSVIAHNRRRASRWDTWLFSRVTEPAEHRLVRWAFMRLLGGTFLIAFTSLGKQVLGLYGEKGIRPIRDLAQSERWAAQGRWRRPSVFWQDASDAALVRGCRVGQALSLALLFNVAPRLSTGALWGLYLSYVSLGREFLSFQWDVLLLEMGLLGALTAPGGVRPGLGKRDVSALEVFLFRMLVFRLYFGSGVSKFHSGDRTWRELSACDVYFETAPLPTRGGWAAHQLPRSVRHAGTAAVLAAETAVPFLAFGPRRVRQAAFGIFSALQAAIMATGNYGFFNVQSLALGLWLLDDGAMRRVLPAGLWRDAEPARRPSVLDTALSAATAVPVLTMGTVELLRRMGWWPRGPERLVRAVDWLEDRMLPLHSVNAYGLFAVMTVDRPEITVEGSDDGVHWVEYPFRYKTSALDRPPRQVAPHQPRLDWQMWFAALGSPPSWFLALLERLLEGSPEVLGLFASNPFPDRPPRMVRAVLHDYRMTSPEERRHTGAWWKRERRGLYVSPLTLAPGSSEQAGRLTWYV
ncbi:lipase maturation factor family protein [Corallococcus macrosporus]|uniref:Lipase maturation factor 2 n=1 Tax=Corallococcus macrosporus TaxID=35 RepID=A0ABS3DHE6_9BACT|nr:lipase maturation factor family protein [Corallococcus macrosporus]MBN8230754.1 lipase maturation factor family protein [Corallococcus macrosporus]